MLISLGRTAILNDALGLDLYGIFIIILNFYGVLNLFLNIKVQDLIFKLHAELAEESDRYLFGGVLNLALFICLLVSFLITFVSLLFLKFGVPTLYSHIDLQALSDALIIYLPLAASLPFQAYLTAVLRLKDRFASILLPQVVSGAVALAILSYYQIFQSGFDLSFAVGVISFTSLLGTLYSFILCLWVTKEERCQLSFYHSIKALSGKKQKIISLLWQTNLASYLKLSSSTGGLFLLGVVAESNQVAVYGIVQQLTRPVTLLQSNIQPSIFPEITKLEGNGEHAKMKLLVLEFTKVLIVLSLISLVGFLVFKNLFFKFVGLDTNSAYLSAVYYVVVAAALVTLLGAHVYPLVVVKNKLKWRNVIVSLRFLYLGVAFIFGLTAFSLACVQLLGTISTRIFVDIPLVRSLINRRIGENNSSF